MNTTVPDDERHDVSSDRKAEAGTEARAEADTDDDAGHQGAAAVCARRSAEDVAEDARLMTFEATQEAKHKCGLDEVVSAYNVFVETYSEDVADYPSDDD